MKILYEPRFVNDFYHIWNFIASDSINRANTFKRALKQQIEDLVGMPYRCRKSIYFDDESIRDLVFKGYTIVYKVDKANDTVLVLGITKYKKEF